VGARDRAGVNLDSSREGAGGDMTHLFTLRFYLHLRLFLRLLFLPLLYRSINLRLGSFADFLGGRLVRFHSLSFVRRGPCIIYKS
jgi:hypothetical protein